MNFGLGFVCGIVAGLALSEVFRRSDRDNATAGYLAVILEGNKLIGVEKMELREGFKVEVQAGGFRTARGNAASIEPGSGRWTSTDESVVSVTPDPNDETKATVEGVDGSANETVAIEFRADGRPGEGDKEIVLSGAVTCTQGDAAVGELQFGTPVEAGSETAGVSGEGGPIVADEPGPGGSGSPDVEPGPANPDGTTADANTLPEVEPGDPGTATGPPIETENPNETDNG